MKHAGQTDDDAELRAQVGVWLARLHADDRSYADEAGFHDWLSEDPRHKAAFDAATQAWEAVGALNIARQGVRARPAQPRRDRGRSVVTRRGLVVGAALAAGLAGVGVWSSLGGWANYVTSVGESRMVALADGSRLLLDTDTIVRARLTANHRQLELVKGRAHFAVAKDPGRPFVVAAGTGQVVAVGTAFDVSRVEGATSVLLLEGHVRVQGNTAYPRKAIADMATPGSRLTISSDGTAVQDRPDLGRLTAWQTGRIVFEHDTLAGAVAEMNRYSSRQIVIGDDALKSLRFSGVYVSGDPRAFATSVAALFDLRVQEEAARTVLKAATVPPAQPS